MTSDVSNSWSEFLAALSNKDDESVLKEVSFPLRELFELQKNVDYAKKILFKAQMGALLKLYLSQIPLEQVSAKLDSHGNNFKRAFGVDKYNHLKLLVKLRMIDMEKRPKTGLLSRGNDTWQELKRV